MCSSCHTRLYHGTRPCARPHAFPRKGAGQARTGSSSSALYMYISLGSQTSDVRVSRRVEPPAGCFGKSCGGLPSAAARSETPRSVYLSLSLSLRYCFCRPAGSAQLMLLAPSRVVSVSCLVCSLPSTPMHAAQRTAQCLPHVHCRCSAYSTVSASRPSRCSAYSTVSASRPLHSSSAPNHSRGLLLCTLLG